MKYVCCCLFLLVQLVLFAQPESWGKKVEGIQFGLVLTHGGSGLVGEIYARNTSLKEKVFISNGWDMQIFYLAGNSRYEATPATLRYISDQPRLMSAAGRPKQFMTYTQLLPKDEEVLLRTFLIGVPEWIADDPCYFLEDRMDEVEVLISNLFKSTSKDTLQTSTGLVRVPYCTDLDFCEQQQRASDRFFNSLLEIDSPEILQLCMIIARDQEQDEYVRNQATRYLATANTQECRDLLYEQCLEEEVLFKDVLDDFLSTKDPRSGEMFEKFWDHEEEEVQTIIAWHIGEQHDEPHFGLLEKLTHSRHRWTRHTAVEAVQKFDSEQGREVLHASLKDPDLGVRTMAARGLAIIGNESSLEHMYEFLVKEDPGHVGYVQVAWETVEKLSGMSFDRDLQKLRQFLHDKQ